MLEIQTIQKQDTTLEGYDATSATLRMIPDSSDLTSLSACYEAELQAASKVGAKPCSSRPSPALPSPSCSGLSARFTGQSLILGTPGESSIKKVCIVCEDDASAEYLHGCLEFLLCGNQERPNE